MANLDTPSKRASSVSLLLTSILTPPFPDGTLAQGDRQHMANSYSGILAGTAAALAFILDMNTRIFQYLKTVIATGTDNTAMCSTNMASRSGEATARLQAIIVDATP